MEPLMEEKDARERCAEKPNDKTKKTEETVCNHVIIMTYVIWNFYFYLIYTLCFDSKKT